MKLLLALFFALVFTQTARADDFATRAAAGRKAAATPLGDEFGNSILPLLQQISSQCDPPGTKLPAAELGPLNIVGNITPTGTLINTEAQPQTPLAACFAATLVKHRFDPPPWPGDYPLFIHLTVRN